MLELKATLALTVIGLRFDTSFLNIFFQSENIEPCYILLLKKVLNRNCLKSSDLGGSWQLSMALFLSEAFCQHFEVS